MPVHIDKTSNIHSFVTLIRCLLLNDTTDFGYGYSWISNRSSARALNTSIWLATVVFYKKKPPAFGFMPLTGGFLVRDEVLSTSFT